MGSEKPTIGKYCQMSYNLTVILDIIKIIGGYEVENIEQLLASEPKLLWQYFSKMCEIPHGSKNESAIATFVAEEMAALGLTVERDEVGNVLVRKPATAGLEDAPVVALQGHLDMVCEKNSATEHDFLKDGVKLKIVDGFLRAEGTTLGADNGIGAACAMAILADSKLKHGPLECLFTIDEEDGMTGAINLKTGWLKAEYLLNLDSEEEGEFCIGCAGGRNSTVTADYTEKTPSADKRAYRLTVSGLRGGHSGMNIKDGLGNANKLLARTLWAKARAFEMEIAAINGGNKVNAIAREAWADIFIAPELFNELKKSLAATQADFRNEYGTVEPGVKLSLTKLADAPAGVIAPQDDWRFISFLFAMPHGVCAMSPSIPGLVQTSTNMAYVKIENGKLLVKMSHRSSIASQLDAIIAKINAFTCVYGFDISQSDGYPGWQPNPDADINDKCKLVYKRVFRKNPVIMAIHAGLECGVIGKKYPKMQMISFGPNILDPHSPDEKLELASVPRFYKFTVKLLEELSK